MLYNYAPLYNVLEMYMQFMSMHLVKLNRVCVSEYRNCLTCHCAKTKSHNVTDVVQCIRWLVR